MNMNKTQILLLTLGLAGVGFGVYQYYFVEKEIEYTLANGVKGTANELIAKGYIPIQVGSTINWVLKSEYDKAEEESGGKNEKISEILAAAGVILPIISKLIL